MLDPFEFEFFFWLAFCACSRGHCRAKKAWNFGLRDSMSTDSTSRITLYVTNFCPYCRMAERLLETREIPYKTLSAEDPSIRAELISSTGWRTVPVIMLDDKLVGGYQELAMLDRSGRLSEMLA